MPIFHEGDDFSKMKPGDQIELEPVKTLEEQLGIKSAEEVKIMRSRKVDSEMSRTEDLLKSIGERNSADYDFAKKKLEQYLNLLKERKGELETKKGKRRLKEELKEEKAENGEADKEKEIAEAREKMREVYNEEQKTEEKPSVEEMFEIYSNQEDKPAQSFQDKVVEKISNTKVSRDFRSKRAENLVGTIEGILSRAGKKIENGANILDAGSGYGEIAAELVNGVENGKAMCVDSKISLSDELKKNMNGKMISISEDAKNINLKDGSIDLATSFYFLQVLDREEKMKVLEEIKRIAKNDILIVDELKREGLEGFFDKVINKTLNGFSGKYEIMTRDEWLELFKESGLNVKATEEFDRNSIAFVLEKESLIVS